MLVDIDLSRPETLGQVSAETAHTRVKHMLLYLGFVSTCDTSWVEAGLRASLNGPVIADYFIWLRLRSSKFGRSPGERHGEQLLLSISLCCQWFSTTAAVSDDRSHREYYRQLSLDLKHMARQVRSIAHRPRLSVSDLESRGKWLSRGDLLRASDVLWARATESSEHSRNRAFAILDCLLVHLWFVDAPPIRTGSMLSVCMSSPGDAAEPNRVSRSLGGVGGFDYSIGGEGKHLSLRVFSLTPLEEFTRCFLSRRV